MPISSKQNTIGICYQIIELFFSFSLMTFVAPSIKQLCYKDYSHSLTAMGNGMPFPNMYLVYKCELVFKILCSRMRTYLLKDGTLYFAPLLFKLLSSLYATQHLKNRRPAPFWKFRFSKPYLKTYPRLTFYRKV